MAVDINHYNALFRDNPGQNDATRYGAKIDPCTGGSGAAPFRCIGIHHLTPDENAGNHHVFLDVLDEQGQRIRQEQIEWTWGARRLDEQAPSSITIDKPDREPGTNIPMNWAQTISVSVKGELSDRVTNLHTRHPAEIGDPDCRAEAGGTVPAPGGNTRDHHSFYVVFQRQPGDGPPPPTDVMPALGEAPREQKRDLRPREQKRDLRPSPPHATQEELLLRIAEQNAVIYVAACKLQDVISMLVADPARGKKA